MLIVKEYIKNNEKKLSSFKKIRIAKHSNLTKKFYQDTTKLTQYTNDLIKTDKDELLKKESNYQKKLNEKRSPNEQTVGEKSYVIDKSLGLIFY